MSSTFVDEARDRAFERLYERYVREVYRYVLAVLRNPAEAEDVTQTTFLNAYRAMQAGAEPHAPHNWLIAIAHNACRTRVRFAMRRPKEVPIDEIVEQLAMPESERVNVVGLVGALGRLPFNQRAAITMRELEGRSYPEIADTLGVSVPAVDALVARARRALRLQAASLRGFAAIQLPRSLRNLVESGDTVGSTLGTGAVAKAAAVLVAAAVAGGVGYSAAGKTSPIRHSAAPARELAVHHASPRRAPALHRHAVRPAPKTHPRIVAASQTPRRAIDVPLSPDPTGEAAPSTPPAGAVSAPAPAQSSSASPAAAANGSSVAPEPSPDLPLPDLPLPAVLPQLPEPPPVPPLPAVPSPPLPLP